MGATPVAEMFPVSGPIRERLLFAGEQWQKTAAFDLALGQRLDAGDFGEGGQHIEVRA